MSKLTAEKLAEMAEDGADITTYLSEPEKGHFSKALKEKNLMRTTVDFSIDMIADLDAIAKSLNISRQAIIKMVLQDYLIKYKNSLK